MENHGLWIDGRWREPPAGRYPVVNPATEEVVGHAPEASPAEVEEAVLAARRAYETWSRSDTRERAAILDRTADLLSERASGVAPLLQAETGATIRVTSTMQLPTAVDRFRRYARGALEPDSIPLPPQPARSGPLAPGGLIGAAALRRPVGVVGCITSYNFPVVNLAGKIAPALAMGNTVVAKPAPQDPLSCLLLGEILQEAGLPDGVFNVVTGSGPAAGEALVASAGVDMISFTGSTAVGKRIAEAGGRTMKRLLLELGGKGAAIVLEDADVRTAVASAGSTWAFHSGQICTAPTRVLAHRSVYADVVEGLRRYAAALEIGDPLRSGTVVGPLISAAQRDRVEAYIAGAREQGARIVTGGTRPDLKPGFYVAPTLVADAAPGATVAQEEIFGPVVVAMPFEDEDEAVAIANGTAYGLHDYVFSADTGRAWRLAARLRSGNVGINTVQRHPETPFGGFKDSGVGRDGGSFGLHAYSELQAVVW
ncbi:aldehyde dehydrogenase family protein [Wenjunlia tyrosinilytica]|uniref:aldehyde dehydrogenase (NAD(+)) n=1 Tax=Wenjunlia tyrosinilytica TaxID=1544741 RepID=A0A917ZLX9_9ACTN|nr:aldehyde dehydrogenase family protein [Wenjunlia tyrosinilytica]GGO86813.1 aldehyde dehydrogenase [Wenjunlia tyrosinilytica]